jgi:hypothetical protein
MTAVNAGANPQLFAAGSLPIKRQRIGQHLIIGD